jgi:hypothetical protein
VEKLGLSCFSGCTNLSEVTFESNSRLSVIESGAFDGCCLLSPVFQFQCLSFDDSSLSLLLRFPETFTSCT